MKRPAWILGLLTACAITTGACAQSSLSVNGVVTSRGSAAQMRASKNAAAALLFKRVESVDWSDATFEEVIDWLRDESRGQVNIIIRWGPLSVENVSQESEFTLKLFNTRVADVLNEVLDAVSEDGQVAYHAFGNTIRISTKQDFGRTLYMRVYDVADLLFRVEDFGEEAPRIDLSQTATSSSGGSSGQSVFQGGGGQGQNQGGEQAEQELIEKLEELRDKIKLVIAPETWEGDAGGGRGRIEIINRSLIVVNTIEVHEQLSGSFSFGG